MQLLTNMVQRYREMVKKALAQFVAGPTCPGLCVKRIQGTDKIWEMCAGQDIRITFEFREDKEDTRAVVLRNVGHHNKGRQSVLPPQSGPPNQKLTSPDP